MYRERRIALIIPCFDVADRVGAVLASIPDFVDAIVAVDDGSTDGTRAVLDAARDPRLQVIAHERNAGVGAAVITGFQRASELGMDVFVKVDGDGQMDLRHLPALLDGLLDDPRYGYAKGNRLLDQKALARMPRVRLAGNWALTFLTKLASGYWHILDPQNGFVAIRRETWALLDPDRIARGYFFENDMLVNLNIAEVRVKDVAIPARYEGERSSMRLRRVIPSFAGLLVRRTIHRFSTKYVVRDFSPIALFVFAGLPLFLWGIGFGAFEWWDHARRDVVTPTGTVMLAVLPLLIGFELLLQALVLDIQNSPR